MKIWTINLSLPKWKRHACSCVKIIRARWKCSWSWIKTGQVTTIEFYKNKGEQTEYMYPNNQYVFIYAIHKNANRESIYRFMDRRPLIQSSMYPWYGQKRVAGRETASRLQLVTILRRTRAHKHKHTFLPQTVHLRWNQILCVADIYSITFYTT